MGIIRWHSRPQTILLHFSKAKLYFLNDFEDQLDWFDVGNMCQAAAREVSHGDASSKLQQTATSIAIIA
jgi:hypothetical protein